MLVTLFGKVTLVRLGERGKKKTSLFGTLVAKITVVTARPKQKTPPPPLATPAVHITESIGAVRHISRVAGHRVVDLRRGRRRHQQAGQGEKDESSRLELPNRRPGTGDGREPQNNE